MTYIDEIIKSTINKIVDNVANNISKKQMSEIEKLLEMASELEFSFQKVKLQIKKTQKISPSGFCVRYRISNKMCEFMNIPYCLLISRTDVTRFINQYIKINNLKDPKRCFILDDKLKILFGNEEKIYWFWLQKYISPHLYKIHMIKYF